VCTPFNADYNEQCYIMIVLFPQGKLHLHGIWNMFQVYLNNIPEGHRPIYTMYAGMSSGKYNDK